LVFKQNTGDLKNAKNEQYSIKNGGAITKKDKKMIYTPQKIG
jgi:hypothetical protein